MDSTPSLAARAPTFSNSPAQTQMLVCILDKITDIETIVLGNADTKIVLKDASVAKDSTFTAGFDTNLSVTKTLEFDGSADTDGKLVLTGGGGADTLSGGSGDDTITGGVGADRINAGGGTNVIAFGAADTFGDTIVAYGTTAKTPLPL